MIQSTEMNIRFKIHDAKSFIQPYIIQTRYISFTEIKHYVKEKHDYIKKINRTQLSMPGKIHYSRDATLLYNADIIPSQINTCNYMQHNTVNTSTSAQNDLHNIKCYKLYTVIYHPITATLRQVIISKFSNQLCNINTCTKHAYEFSFIIETCELCTIIFL